MKQYVKKAGDVIMKKTKIICSIGPASCGVDVMTRMVNAGMNVARINFSHATLEEKQNVVAAVKEVRRATGNKIGILYDTKGPEFRNGIVENGEISLVEGKTIRIVKENVVGNEQRFSVNHPGAIASLKVGDDILLENGLMKIQVISVEEDGVTCVILNGGQLGDRKSLSVPGVELDIPFVSEQDREDIIYACHHDGNFIALSFVSTKEDVLEVKEILKQEHREDMKLIAKIESQTGIDNLDEIIPEVSGIMVARGDLGVEVPMYELPILQKMMIRKCREQGKIAIVATEMLESMKKNARPTRAEISDISNAVLDGTDAVMLSGETTLGKYPVETVSYMAGICNYAEQNYNYKKKFEDLRRESITRTIAHSVVEAAHVLDVKAIIAPTMSGYTAKRISNLKPRSVILAGCTDEDVACSLSLNWGVYPFVLPVYESINEVMQHAEEAAKNIAHLQKGDTIILTGSFSSRLEPATTNLMTIDKI